jgi:hypothetical protein
VAYVLVPVGQVLPESPATFQLVFRSPTTWIYHLSGSASYFTAASSRCRLRTRSRESVQVTCPVPTTLTRRETDLPGWGAQVDGRAVAVRKADGPFQAITVGPGTHRVTFGYLPPNVDWGLAAFAVGCGWLVIGVVGLRRRRRSVESRESSIG